MTTETIRCPGCGEEILQDVENCPYCDAPISVIMNNDISGAPIDNSAAIDAMLRSASQFMEESESLGLGELDIFDEDDEDDQKEEVFKKVTLKELPPELSETQKDEIEAGGVINLTPEEESVPAPATPPAPQKKTRQTKADHRKLRRLQRTGAKKQRSRRSDGSSSTASAFRLQVGFRTRVG